MKSKKGELRPFNKIIFVLFEKDLQKLKYSSMDNYRRTKQIKHYLKYLQQTKQKVNLSYKNQDELITNYFLFLKETKDLKEKEINQKKQNLELFYSFLEKYI